jgi:SAM-dependent methyltransferase
VKLLQRIRNRIASEQFDPTWLSILINPTYIIRSKLVHEISKFRHEITGNVLDFGCGQKPYENLFGNVSTYVGVDIKESGHDHTSSKVDVFWDGKTLPFKDGSFDNVVAFEVLEHVFEVENAITEIHRVLKPGGGLLVSTPFMYKEHEAPFDSARYTSWGMHHLLGKSKFQVLEQKKTSGAVGVICQVALDALGKHFVKFGHLGFIAFVPFMTVINTIGSIPSVKKSTSSSEMFLNLVTYARKA